MKQAKFPYSHSLLILFHSFLMFLNILGEIKLSRKFRKKPQIYSRLHEPNLQRSNGVTQQVIYSETPYLDIASFSTSSCTGSKPNRFDAGVDVPALPFTSCVNSGKFLSISLPGCLICQSASLTVILR